MPKYRRNRINEEIAKELDISLSYYCLIEQGKRQNPMDLTLCTKLAKIFSIPILRIVDMETKEQT